MSVRDLRNDKPDLLEKRRHQIIALLSQQTTQAGVDYQQLVLGGFSQGAMLATDVCLALPQRVGGLIVWSGSLLNEPEWTRLAKGKAGLQVVQSHGEFDPILPFAGAELLRDLFDSHGIKTQFLPFHGQHTIPQLGITYAADLIAKMAAID